MNLKVSLFPLCLLLAPAANAQTHLKANIASAMLGVINVGIERPLMNRWTWQADLTTYPWGNFFNHHVRFLMLHTEARYYLKNRFQGWYGGANIGGSVFDLTKYNYWNVEGTPHQVGFNYMLGVTVGYQFFVNERWNLDAFLGAGTVQSFYKGYVIETGLRGDGAEGWNKSGEFLPYRGGLMLTYKL